MSGRFSPLLLLLSAALIISTAFLPFLAGAAAGAGHVALNNPDGIRRFDFHVKYTNFTRLCHTKRLVTVNDEFPGPAIVVREGERILVNVSNEMPDRNITIHWHGIRQLRTAWFDGPAYITQCPIPPGGSFVYNFTVTGQRGTMWWHAHISWMRSTVHGAFIVLPKSTYPFPQPVKEIPLILGEWWNSDTEAVIAQALQSGAGPNVSDAYTINGQPGALYSCSAKDMFKLAVARNETYLLRIVNAGLNDELFVSVANHTLTVVEIDATYTKPLKTETILIAPGQTTSALLRTDQAVGRYVLAIRAYNSAGPTVPFDNTTGSAVVEYAGASNTSTKLLMPTLPAYNDTALANNLSASLRSINSHEFPALVPTTVDRHLMFTVGLARKPCPRGKQCQGPSGGKFAAAMSNISFTMPSTALLQSFFFDTHNMSNTASTASKAAHAFPTSFPDKPTMPFDYTGAGQPKSLLPKVGTRLSWIAFNASVQLVLQGTSILGTESHPIHLHGYNFFMVGQGTGNFNATRHPATFNLVDPPERNTIGVPKGGWVALRFRADNPGVWFMHCHLEIHTSWGLEAAFLVTNGKSKHQSLQPPPLDLPSC